MLLPVWNAYDKPNMQASVIEEVDGTPIYTLKAENESVCLMVNGALLRVGFSNRLPAIRDLLSSGADIPAMVRDNVLSSLAAYANGNGWSNLQFARAVGLEEEAAEARCWREYNKEAREAEEEEKRREREAEKAREAKERLIEAEEAFKAGDYINGIDFQGLLVKYDLWSSVPIRTKGWILNKLESISTGGYRGYSRGDSVFKWSKKLQEVIQ